MTSFYTPRHPACSPVIGTQQWQTQAPNDAPACLFDSLQSVRNVVGEWIVVTEGQPKTSRPTPIPAQIYPWLQLADRRVDPATSQPRVMTSAHRSHSSYRQFTVSALIEKFKALFVFARKRCLSDMATRLAERKETAIKETCTDNGTQCANAMDALQADAYRRREAHDTLAYTCARANLAPLARAAIFNDCTVTRLMEATAGMPSGSPETDIAREALSYKLIEECLQAYLEAVCRRAPDGT